MSPKRKGKKEKRGSNQEDYDAGEHPAGHLHPLGVHQKHPHQMYHRDSDDIEEEHLAEGSHPHGGHHINHPHQTHHQNHHRDSNDMKNLVTKAHNVLDKVENRFHINDDFGQEHTLGSEMFAHEIMAHNSDLIKDVESVNITKHSAEQRPINLTDAEFEYVKWLDQRRYGSKSETENRKAPVKTPFAHIHGYPYAATFRVASKEEEEEALRKTNWLAAVNLQKLKMDTMLAGGKKIAPIPIGETDLGAEDDKQASNKNKGINQKYAEVEYIGDFKGLSGKVFMTPIDGKNHDFYKNERSRLFDVNDYLKKGRSKSNANLKHRKDSYSDSPRSVSSDDDVSGSDYSDDSDSGRRRSKKSSSKEKDNLDEDFDDDDDASEDADKLTINKKDWKYPEFYPSKSNQLIFPWYKFLHGLKPAASKRFLNPATAATSRQINLDKRKEIKVLEHEFAKMQKVSKKPKRTANEIEDIKKMLKGEGDGPIDVTKDFLNWNARQTLLIPPKRPVPIYIDDAHGTRNRYCPSGLARIFVYKPDYGSIPTYLRKRNQELGRPPVPDFRKFYKPHVCKFIFGHFHCKMCGKKHLFN